MKFRSTQSSLARGLQFVAIWRGRLRSKPATAATIAVTIGSVFLLAIGLILPSGSRANEQAEYSTFTVDVTQDADTNRQLDVDPSEGQINFSRGDAYIVDGPIYLGHTLASGQPNNDPKAPGAIGTYRLRATFLAGIDDFNRAVADDPTAPRVLSFGTEMFSFSDGNSTIITEGEWPNAHRSARRAIIGGTGQFAGVVGEADEQNIGENKQGFCNSRVTFRFRKDRSGH
jgi:hypothetical protein